ncbi:methyltransferase domain-containing protein [Mycobacterium sp.]|uniref:methyltransferase domain-containing protein n=1 Tax=Mycobacterium sp. TaxID=1785 RepID=UPI002B9C760D|nr:methyltransferase domain-containing protein [Mycobacterium sp.]HKP39468.1 methyltransferase domain-containing protein [Mycobacterium sp.]
MTDASRQALRANAEHYSQPDAFEYVSTKYHDRRIRVARELLEKYLPPTSERLVLLDVGPGNTSPVNMDSYPRATRIAVDATRSALQRSHGFTDRVCADSAAGLPFADESINAIYCGELIEHLFDPRIFLHDCHRVLAPDGLLLVTTPNIATLQDRIRFLFGRSPRHIDPLHPYIRLHIRPFTPDLLARTLLDANLIPVETRSNFIDLHIQGKRYNVPYIARITPNLGGTIITIGRKGKY